MAEFYINKPHNKNSSAALIRWSSIYETGIEVIDKQHKSLVVMTNQLFHACTRGGDKREAVFKDVMRRMVEYVNYHFRAEEELFERIKYPYAAEHKREHDRMILHVLDASQEYSDGKKHIANKFARSLKDWIVSHVGHSDRMFAIYIVEQKKKGLLSDKDITGED